MSNLKIKVSGMNCNHCKINVERGLQQVTGIRNATADIVNGEVSISGNDDIKLEQVKSTIESLGYTYGGEIK